MSEVNSRHLAPLVSVGFLILAACASAPPLVSKSAVVPAGIDLSGNWQMREHPGGAVRVPELDGHKKIVIPKGRSSHNRERRKRSGMSAQVFLEYGESLKISQTDFGIFISYDRSIVEEYTFGENRLVTIGPIEANRVSGWEANAFVVETLDDDGTTLTESWHLENNDSVLVRNIRINKGEKEKFALRQVFDRK